MYRRGARVGKPAGGTAPRSERNAEVNVVRNKMNDGVDPDSIWRATMLVLGPGIPVHVGERGIVSECAIGPCRVLRTEEVGEAGLGRGVVDAESRGTGDPDVGREPVPIDGLSRVGTGVVDEGSGRAGPDGGRAADQRRGQRRQTEAKR